jgi:microcompartment protein CcmL/EutN
MRLAAGIGGNGYFSMTGELYQIQAAVDAAREIAGYRVVGLEVISRPHVDLLGFLSGRGRAP